MKVKEKRLARKLRKQRWSINEIYRKLGVAKSSVSLWVTRYKINICPKAKVIQKKELKKT